MQRLRVLALAGVMLACAHPLVAQQSVDYASVSGRVTDPSGAVVPDAQVTVRHTQTNVIATTVTGRDGRFRFPYLRIGRYQITVSQQGFKNVTRALNLTPGSAFELPVTLSVGALDTSVTVTGEASVLEAARSQIAATVSEAEARTLPLNRRSILELALLVPGVAPANVASPQLFRETSAVPGVSLSVGSQRNLSNNFIVDGLSANDDAAALSAISYGLDAIEEFQVVTSGGQAEFGRALGGYVNVVTKSGTNVLHGTVYDYIRNDRFNVRNALSATKLPMSQSQYGGSLGGPIVSDRTFYFTNVEQRRLKQTGLVTISPENVCAVNARLASVGYQGPLVKTGMYPNPVDSTNLLGKVDHQASGRDQFNVRYSLYHVSSENSRGAGGLSAPSASAGLQNLDQTIAAGNTLTLSTRTVLETRAQLAHSDLKAPPADSIGPAVTIAGVSSFGTLSGAPTRRINRMYQVVNNLSHQAGAHAVRVGADFLYNDDRITFPRAIRGSYTFSSLASFLAGVYNNAGFTQRDRRVAGEPEPRRVRARRMEGEPQFHPELRSPIRPAVPRDDQHRHEQRLAACRDGLVTVRLAPHHRPRERRPLLRSCSAPPAGERVVVCGKHDRPEQPASNQRQPVSSASGRTGVPPNPQSRRPVGHAAEPHHHGPRPAERVLASGKRGG